MIFSFAASQQEEQGAEVHDDRGGPVAGTGGPGNYSQKAALLRLERSLSGSQIRSGVQIT